MSGLDVTGLTAVAVARCPRCGGWFKAHQSGVERRMFIHAPPGKRPVLSNKCAGSGERSFVW